MLDGHRVILLAFAVACGGRTPVAGPTGSNGPEDSSSASGDAGTSETGLTSSGASTINLRLESGSVLRSCDGEISWEAPDGALLKISMDLCGNDTQLLADLVVSNLEAVDAAGNQVMLVLPQGTNLPSDWITDCGADIFALDSGDFSGTICLPWNAEYQANLRETLTEIATAVTASEAADRALAGVYFTVPTMTNGAELHWRVSRADFPYPGDDLFRQSYFDVLDIFQEAFARPVVFEAGHCLWSDIADCDLPVLLLEHSVAAYGTSRSGIAVWNGAERYDVDPDSDSTVFPVVMDRAQELGVSIGMQTVGAFMTPCRFTLDGAQPGDRLWYGDRVGIGRDVQCLDELGNDITDNPPLDLVARACVDTMTWFVAHGGTWAENWSGDFGVDGVYALDGGCTDAIDALIR